jgi:hypothetical protein
MKTLSILLILGGLLVAPVAEAKPKHKGKKVPPGHAHGHYKVKRKGPPAHVYERWDRDRVYYYEDEPYFYRDGGWRIHLPGGVTISR